MPTLSPTDDNVLYVPTPISDAPTSDWDKVRANPAAWGLGECPCGLNYRLDSGGCDHGEDPGVWEHPTCLICHVAADWMVYARKRNSVDDGYGAFRHESVCDDHLTHADALREQGWDVITPELF